MEVYETTGEDDMSPRAGWGRDIGGTGMVCQELERSGVRSGVFLEVWVEMEKALRGLLDVDDGTRDTEGDDVTVMTAAALTWDLRL